MGEAKSFLKYNRKEQPTRPVEQRIKDYQKVELPLTPDEITQQAARCMDCGIPFCHGFGCPVENLVPDFNELVYQGRWRQACELLHKQNNFPEITARICPAPCEAACTLSVNDEPVTIRHIEYHIAEKGFENNWIKPQPAKIKTTKKVAVIGSGPAGLTVAQQLARAGHEVVVFEKNEKPGGLLRYGIPDFKLEKNVIDRRLNQLKAEGIEFQAGVEIGEDISGRYLHKMFDAICLAMGAEQARDLNVPGRGYENILFAWDYLANQNKICSGELTESDMVTAKGKSVVVIGGGDTGSDCVGTARRQGAKNIYQLEILPKPPQNRPPETPWPNWPNQMRTSSSQEEGVQRMWSVMTKKFRGIETRVSSLNACKVDWKKDESGNWKMKEIPGSEFELKADLVLLSLGFVHLKHQGLIEQLELELDGRGNLKNDSYQTNLPWVFAAGDSESGASLVVKAIKSARQAAESINNYLKKTH
jgi:glutamate synthase (NADPH/NADH) small chain